MSDRSLSNPLEPLYTTFRNNGLILYTVLMSAGRGKLHTLEQPIDHLIMCHSTCDKPHIDYKGTDYLPTPHWNNDLA